jgi:hypothetical protein
MIEKLEVIEHLSTSDHNTICWQLICDIRQVTVSRAHRQYARGDYDSMKRELAQICWEEEFKGLAIDDTWLRFKDILDLVVVRYVPLVKGKRNKYPQWMTREAKRARKYKVNKWKEYRPHAQKTVGQIQIIVAGGGHVEFDGGSARYVRYWVVFDVNPAFDTRLRRRQREEV